MTENLQPSPSKWRMMIICGASSELQVCEWVCVLSRPSCCVISFSKGCLHPHLPRKPPVLALSLTFYLDITLACISSNVNSEWMGWDVEVNDDALTAVYMKLSEGFLNPQSHFTRTSSLKSIRWLGLNLSTDSHTHTHTQGGSYSLSTPGF